CFIDDVLLPLPGALRDWSARRATIFARTCVAAQNRRKNSFADSFSPICALRPRTPNAQRQIEIRVRITPHEFLGECSCKGNLSDAPTSRTPLRCRLRVASTQATAWTGPGARVAAADW